MCSWGLYKWNPFVDWSGCGRGRHELHSVETPIDGSPFTYNSLGYCWCGWTIGDVFVRPRPTFLKPFSVEVPWYSQYRRALILRPPKSSYHLAHKERHRVRRQRPLTCSPYCTGVAAICAMVGVAASWMQPAPCVVWLPGVRSHEESAVALDRRRP